MTRTFILYGLSAFSLKFLLIQAAHDNSKEAKKLLLAYIEESLKGVDPIKEDEIVKALLDRMVKEDEEV